MYEILQNFENNVIKTNFTPLTKIIYLVAANKQSFKVPLSDFYNTLVDYIELVADFNTWELRSGLVNIGGLVYSLWITDLIYSSHFVSCL